MYPGSAHERGDIAVYAETAGIGVSVHRIGQVEVVPCTQRIEDTQEEHASLRDTTCRLMGYPYVRERQGAFRHFRPNGS